MKKREKLDFIPNDIVCLDDYERYANKILDINALSYISSGVANQVTYRKNIEAFDEIYIDGSNTLEEFNSPNKKVKLFGYEFNTPIMIAPVAHQKLVDDDGEISTAMAANALETPMVVSSFSNSYLEDIVKVTTTPLIFQLYIQPDMNENIRLIKLAYKLGYKAIMVTIDAPISGVRNIQQRVGFELPNDINCVNIKDINEIQTNNNLENILQLASILPTWQTIKEIKKISPLPIILKGISSKEYAKKAIDLGIDAIVVSNHGGRTLDTLLPSIKILPRIVDEVKGRIPVLFDGGIRRGTDVLKALALGADMIMIGRPIIYALATAGALGVAHTLKIINEELEIAMVLTGCNNIKDIKNIRLI